MKKLFLFFLLVHPSLQAFAQDPITDEFEYKATYQLTYQPDSTDASSATSEEMWLYLGDEISRFSSKGKALKDFEKISGGNMADLKARAAMTRTEFDYVLYKDVPEDKISFTLKVLNDKLRYEDEKGLFEWEILPETETIQGYVSQKATTTFRGREYTAWFTSEIPISDGPYKFHGLPGLILQVADNKNHYVFELAEFKKLGEPVPVKVDLGESTLTSREKLLQIKREFQENPFAALENANRGSTKKVTIQISKQEKREHLNRIKKELEKKNNPIELN